MAQEIVRNVRLNLISTKPQGGKMPVVMGNGESGILLHEAIGHTFEADFIRKKTSVFCNQLGNKICNPEINIVDDGTIPYNRGSINYDDEGVASQKTYLITSGVLTGFLHDRIFRSRANGKRAQSIIPQRTYTANASYIYGEWHTYFR